MIIKLVLVFGYDWNSILIKLRYNMFEIVFGLEVLWIEFVG